MGNGHDFTGWKKNRNLLALIIIRRSSAGQKDNTSAETQRRVCLDYAKEQGLQCADEQIAVITETAFYSSDREKYRRLIKEALKTGIRHVLFYSSNREARNSEDLEWLESIIREDKIVVHYADSKKVFWSGSSDSDWLSRDIDGVLNKQYSRELSTRIKAANQTKLKKGIFPYKPPLGYVRVMQTNAKGEPIKGSAQIGVDPDEENVRLVQREFALRAQGYSYDRIFKTIKKEKLVPLAKLSTYSRSTLTKRLKNRLYWGEVIDEGTGEVYEGTHPKIISDDVLKKVHKVNQGNAEFTDRPHIYNRDAGHFKNLMKCGHRECGCEITYDPHEKNSKNGSKKIYDYYRCANGRGLHEKRIHIREEDLWAAVDLSVKPFQIPSNLANSIATKLNAEALDQQRKIRKSIATLQSEIELNSATRARTVALYVEGRLAQDDYENQTALLDQRLTDAKAAIKKSEEALKSINLVTAADVQSLARGIDKIWRAVSRAEKSKLVRLICASALLEDISLLDQVEAKFNLKEHFQKLTQWAPMIGRRTKSA